MFDAPTPPRSPHIVFLAVLTIFAVGLGLAAAHQSLPTGTYATAITIDDIPASFPFPPEAFAGQWQVEFTPAGSVIVSRNGELAAVGHYSSNSAVVEMTDVLGPYACEQRVETGRHRWTREDGELVLTPEADLCDGRVAVLTARPLVAMASNAGGQLLTSWLSDEDPGLPYYARVESTPPYVLHDDDFAAIVFYRGPEGIPEDFNLLAFFDLPTGPESLGAFAVPLNVSGTYVWSEEVWVGAPRIINSLGLGSVPVWFVPTIPLLAHIDANDRVLTMADLRGIAGIRVGSATQFQEALHPIANPSEMGGGGHPRPSLRIIARGTLEGGGQFAVSLSKAPVGASIRFHSLPVRVACADARSWPTRPSLTSC
jgi:hypothetical protein